MQIRPVKSLSVIGALLCAAAVVQPARAQGSADEKEKPPIYTYVAEWSVPRADWVAMEKSDANTNKVLAKLMADGTITGYGTFKSLVHHEGSPTHGDWWSATSMGNLMKALAVVSNQGGAGSADDARVLAGSKHWDFIMESRNYGNHSGTFENCYLRVGSWTIKPGEGANAEKAIKFYLVPILEKLLAEGAIHGYAIDREAIHTEDPGEADIVIFANGGDGLDKFEAALDAAGKENPLGAPAFGNTVDSPAHRDSLSLATATFK